MIGEDRTRHRELADQLAYAISHEIVCGRVTPASDAEAKRDEYWECSWLPALRKEVDALFKMGTFEFVPRSTMVKQGYKTKKTKTVYKWKVDRDGEIKGKMSHCRARVQPNSKCEYFDLFFGSQPLQHEDVAYISAQTGERLSSADVGNAYLEALLHDDVFIEQHPE